MASIRDRLMRLETKRRFLDWFVRNRFYESLTTDELEIFVRDGQLPNPLPNRPSRLDGVDRKRLIGRWEEDELKFGARSPEELEFFAEHGVWPEQRGRLHYSMQDGRLFVEWRNASEEENIRAGTMTQQRGTQGHAHFGGTNDKEKPSN